MKVVIGKHGYLNIIPETEFEDSSLHEWYKEYKLKTVGSSIIFKRLDKAKKS